MKVRQTPLPGVLVITPQIFKDSRGEFSESFNLRKIEEAGLPYQPYCTPYPGFGNQPRFHKTMTGIIPNLPVTNGSEWKEY